MDAFISRTFHRFGFCVSYPGQRVFWKHARGSRWSGTNHSSIQSHSFSKPLCVPPQRVFFFCRQGMVYPRAIPSPIKCIIKIGGGLGPPSYWLLMWVTRVRLEGYLETLYQGIRRRNIAIGDRKQIIAAGREEQPAFTFFVGLEPVRVVTALSGGESGLYLCSRQRATVF